MICSNCKMEIPDDSVFCQYCGQALMQKVKIEDGIKKKSKKPIVVILLVAVFLSIAAFGAYFGTYLAAVNKAQEGDVEEARKLLICPSITKIHDPDLLPYLSAWEQLNSRDVSGYLLIESLAKEKDYSLAVQNLPSAKIAAYHHGLKLYEEGQPRAARKFFLALDSFENRNFKWLDNATINWAEGHISPIRYTTERVIHELYNSQFAKPSLQIT